MLTCGNVLVPWSNTSSRMNNYRIAKATPSDLNTRADWNIQYSHSTASTCSVYCHAKTHICGTLCPFLLLCPFWLLKRRRQ